MKLSKILLIISAFISFEVVQAAYAGPRSLSGNGGRSRNIYGVGGNSNIYGTRGSGNIFGTRRLGNRSFGVRGSSFARSSGTNSVSSGVNGGYSPGSYESATGGDEQVSYEYHPMSDAERQREFAVYEYGRQFDQE